MNMVDFPAFRTVGMLNLHRVYRTVTFRTLRWGRSSAFGFERAAKMGRGWGAEDGACDRVSRKGRLPCIARGGASECQAVVEAKARRPGFRLTSGALPFGGRVPPSGEKCGIIGANEPKGAARRGHAMREAAPLASERTAHGTRSGMEALRYV